MAGSRAKPIPDAEWNQNRDLILDLYTRMPLHALVKFMASHVSFYATTKQYKRKLDLWGACKNQKRYLNDQTNVSNDQYLPNPVRNLSPASQRLALDPKPLTRPSLDDQHNAYSNPAAEISTRTSESLACLFTQDFTTTSNHPFNVPLLSDRSSLRNTSWQDGVVHHAMDNSGALGAARPSAHQCPVSHEFHSCIQSLLKVRALVLMHLLLTISQVTLVLDPDTRSEMRWPPYRSDICTQCQPSYATYNNVFDSSMRTNALELYEKFGSTDEERRLIASLTIKFLAYWKLNSSSAPQPPKTMMLTLEGYLQRYHASVVTGAFLSATFAARRTPNLHYLQPSLNISDSGIEKRAAMMNASTFTFSESRIAGENIMLILNQMFVSPDQCHLPDYCWFMAHCRWSETWSQQSEINNVPEVSSAEWFRFVEGFVEVVTQNLFQEQDAERRCKLLFLNGKPLFDFRAGSLPRHLQSELGY